MTAALIVWGSVMTLAALFFAVGWRLAHSALKELASTPDADLPKVIRLLRKEL